MSHIIEGFLLTLAGFSVVALVFGWIIGGYWLQDRYGERVSVPFLFGGMFIAAWVAITVVEWGGAK